LEIIIALILGIIVGYFINLNKKQKKLNGKLQQLGVIFLLFSMGASIGANENIINDLPKIGIKAFTYASFTILGSVVLVFLLTNRFLKSFKTSIDNEENIIKEKELCTKEIKEEI
jgi:Kef-type K+ transport system membrane component KefB